jgi:hypothetical protein
VTVPYPVLTGAEPCRSADPELFFPDPGDNRGAELAKAICWPCLTRDACAAFGGLSPKERQAWRRRRAAA